MLDIKSYNQKEAVCNIIIKALMDNYFSTRKHKNAIFIYRSHKWYGLSQVHHQIPFHQVPLLVRFRSTEYGTHITGYPYPFIEYILGDICIFAMATVTILYGAIRRNLKPIEFIIVISIVYIILSAIFLIQFIINKRKYKNEHEEIEKIINTLLLRETDAS
jgi:hypothetical protein